MPRRFRRLAVNTMAFAYLASPLCGQIPASGDAASVYRKVAGAVFLIEVRDSTGRAVAVGSAFLISGGRILTNAHVVADGRPFLKTGAVALPLTVERLDASVDLALLRAGAPLETTALELGVTDLSPGMAVFALGNPRGLENSISEGIVSGVREREGRRLLQITAPISPGSSGGPVLGKDGQVYGVTVGYLEGGQNLNFAIPGSVVRQFLNRPAGSATFATALANAEQAARVSADYRDSAAFNQRRRDVLRAIDDASAAAKTGDEFLAVATIASREFAPHANVTHLSEESLRGHTQLPDSARALMMNAWIWPLFFNLDSLRPSDLQRMLAVADTLASHRTRDASTQNFRSRVLSALGRGAEAATAASKAIGLAADSSSASSYWTTYHEVTAAHFSGANDDAVFARMVQAKMAAYYDWSEHADHLMKREQWSEAGAAFAQAYRGMPSVAVYACNAGEGYWKANQNDLALDAFRVCIETSSRSNAPDSAKMAYAHRGIATILNDRGVSAQAETHARQARILNPEDSWIALELSRALLDQDRASEAAVAAEEAIRLSDGKFSSMHFAAGRAYFKLQDWSKCSRAFQHAAELATTDDGAPYNLALCLARQGFMVDAAQWMETAIRRNPTSTDRANREALVKAWRGKSQ